MIEQLIEHWPEATLVTVPTSWLAYVTQFPRSHRQHHRRVIVGVVRRVLVDPVRVQLIVWSVTWDVPDPPWWRRLLSWARHRDTTGS